jgi:hypothetical protein
MPATRLLTTVVAHRTTATGPDWGAISQLVAGCDTAARALTGDDPALGFTGPAAVLLLEPSEPLLATDPATGRAHDLQVELLVRRGFQRFLPGTPVPAPLPGWSVRVGPAGLELNDGAGNPWACPEIVPDPSWLSHVDDRVLVLYGPLLGVRPPRGVPDAQYGPAQRAGELRGARTRGLVAAALIAGARLRERGTPAP